MNYTRRMCTTGCLLLLFGYLGLALVLGPTVAYTTTGVKNESCDEDWLWSVIPAYISMPYFAIASIVLVCGLNRKLYQIRWCSIILTSGVSLAFLVIGGISFHLTSFRLSLCLANHEHVELWYFVPVLLGNFLMILMFKILEMAWIMRDLPKGKHMNSLATQSVCTQNKLTTALCIANVSIGYGALIIYCTGKLLSDYYVYKVMNQDFPVSAPLYYLPVVLYPLGSSYILAYLMCSKITPCFTKVSGVLGTMLIMNSAFLACSSAEQIWGNSPQYASDPYYWKVNAVALVGSALITITSGLLKLLWVFIIKQRSVTQYTRVPAEEMEGEI